MGKKVGNFGACVFMLRHCPLDMSPCSEVTSGFYYSDADQRQRLVSAERKYTDDRVDRIIALKKEVRAAAARANSCMVRAPVRVGARY
jgi:hypothetical protein